MAKKHAREAANAAALKKLVRTGEVARNGRDRHQRNAEAAEVSAHKRCTGGFGERCARHGWLVGLSPYGWSANGGAVDGMAPKRKRSRHEPKELLEGHQPATVTPVRRDNRPNLARAQALAKRHNVNVLIERRERQRNGGR